MAEEPAPRGLGCPTRRRRAIDLKRNCADMLKKYGSCSGHSYSRLMKIVCRKTCKTATTDC
ncbi:hypothetical protein AAVH_06435 [Aphelenchoides avenae]|nr:hypothetical protein AAVH_06435 [Aphelenchus avenae]